MTRFNELRWNPILKTWIIISSVREKRPWRPKNYCPFCPGTEEMGYGWKVKVVKNKFPALVKKPVVSLSHVEEPYKIMPGYGICEVVVETPSHKGDLDTIGNENLKLYLKTLRDEYLRLGRDPRVKYVFEFRNKGTAIGVSLSHPHSQIYALPFIPRKIARELESARSYFNRNKSCLFCKILEIERKEKVRLLYENNYFIAFTPYYAMWPYEIHVFSKEHKQNISQFSDVEIESLADILRIVVATYNNLFKMDFPYIMAIHQEPTDGKFYRYYHFHIEFYSPQRTKEKLKYAAGIEWGTETFTYDGLPEEKAKELRKSLEEVVNSKKYDLKGKIVK